MRSTRVPARVAVVGIPVVFLLFAAVAVLPAFGRSLVRSADSLDDLHEAVDWQGILGLPVLGVSLVAVPVVAGCFVVWLRRSRGNLAAVPGSRARWHPGWTVGGWLVPVVLPFVVAEVARESGVGRLRAGLLTWGWWLGLVGGLLLSPLVRAEAWQTSSTSFAILAPVGQPPSDAVKAEYLTLFAGPAFSEVLPSLALLALAAGCAVALVRLVTRAQRRPPDPTVPPG